MTLGGGPTTRQRKLIAELTANVDSLGAVIFDSTMVRGIVTALNWVAKVKLRAFRLRDYRQAFSYVELDAPERFAAEMGAIAEACEGNNPIKTMFNAGADV